MHAFGHQEGADVGAGGGSIIGTAIEEAGWIGRLVMCIVPILKSLESFLFIVPLAIVTAYKASLFPVTFR